MFFHKKKKRFFLCYLPHYIFLSSCDMSVNSTRVKSSSRFHFSNFHFFYSFSFCFSHLPHSVYQQHTVAFTSHRVKTVACVFVKFKTLGAFQNPENLLFWFLSQRNNITRVCSELCFSFLICQKTEHTVCVCRISLINIAIHGALRDSQRYWVWEFCCGQAC